LHSSGVLHRDLKPANILIFGDATTCDTTRCCTWRPVLSDFGSACVLPASPSTMNVNLRRSVLPRQRYCTLYYSAPEVLMAGCEYDFPSDMWSLG
jgi:serine/threonine protein kinase